MTTDGQRDEGSDLGAPSARRERILRELGDSGQVDVARLASELRVSEMTVRRDLRQLDQAGLLRRIHGGAIVQRSPFSQRASDRADEKTRIAEAVADLLGPGDTVGIDIGTTCRAVAAAVSHRDDVLAVTNSLQAALEFQHSRSPVYVLGGVLTSDASLVSGGLVEQRRNIHLDKLVLGCGGISAAHGITYFEVAETEVRQQLMEQADTVILAADHTKFTQRRAISLGGVELLDVFVTTAEPPGELRAALDQHGVRLVVV